MYEGTQPVHGTNDGEGVSWEDYQKMTAGWGSEVTKDDWRQYNQQMGDASTQKIDAKRQKGRSNAAPTDSLADFLKAFNAHFINDGSISTLRNQIEQRLGDGEDKDFAALCRSYAQTWRELKKHDRFDIIVEEFSSVVEKVEMVQKFEEWLGERDAKGVDKVKQALKQWKETGCDAEKLGGRLETILDDQLEADEEDREKDAVLAEWAKFADLV
jgi:hypothetical protein